MPKVKQLAMISSKIKWNGKQSSFDELKQVAVGHFDGNSSSYLINQKFLNIYDEYDGHKVLHFFPRKLATLKLCSLFS